MKILGINEIPEEWRTQLDQTGLGRYSLFVEELQKTNIVALVSLKGVIDILESARGENFPYKDIKIGKPNIPHWKKLNRTGHMGILIQTNKGTAIKLLEGTIDNALMLTKWRNADFPNITI